MPSGSKKRKAAKKRKEKEARDNNSSASINSNNPQEVIVGNEDPKSQDERESESSEVASPLSQGHHKDHNHQHHFAEVSEKRTTGEVERSNAGQVDDGKLEKEPKTMKNAERNGIDFKHVESVKEPLNGNERSSSSSSSDDEYQAFARKQEKVHESVSNVTSNSNKEKTVDNASEEVTQICVEGEPVKEANGNSDVESSPAVNFDTTVMSMSEVVRPLMESVKVESSDLMEVAESALVENMDKMLPVSNETTGVPLSLLSQKSEDKLTLDEDVGESSNVSATAVNGNEAKTSNVNIVCTAQTSMDEKDFKDSQFVVGAANGNEGKMLTTSGVCAADTNNDIQNAKESETFESTETQPLVDSAPQVAQRTSWMSCCGLFEVFTGSSK